MSQAKIPRTGVPCSEWTFEEILALQGWELDDIIENRAGRLSASQKQSLSVGHRDLFGLLRVGLPKKQIAAGIVSSVEGVCEKFEGPNMNGPSLKLTVDGRLFFWTDEENYRASEAPAARTALLEHWVQQRQRVCLYFFAPDNLVAMEAARASS
jgi:hypothetical protein